MKLAPVPADSNFIDADLHNFGQRVEIQTRACGTDWFRKPRTVYWEWFFFGKDSPLKPLFEAGVNGQFRFSDYIFNLDTEISNQWLGYSKRIHGSTTTPEASHFYSFGALLAYCYVFGIRDLHSGNLLMTPTHLQVIDAEVVLTRLVLPHETVLLPFKEVRWQKSGVGALVSESQLSSENGEIILSGYFDMFTHLIKNRSLLLKKFEGVTDLDIPIRVLLRNTVDYKTAKDFLSEEFAQLLRNDIPYFFKRLGQKELLWLEKKDTEIKTGPLGRFEPDIARHAIHPSVILSEEMISNERLVQGAFLIYRKLGLSSEYRLKNNTQINSRSIFFESSNYQLTHS